MDFYTIRSKTLKKGSVCIYPAFLTGKPKDIMFRSKSFYAIWDEEKGTWSTDESDVIRIIDDDLRKRAEKHQKQSPDDIVSVQYLSDYENGKWKEFCNYAKQSPDNAVTLDNKLTFANTVVKRDDYSSKRLPYPLEPGDYSAWDELIGTLYNPEEREKIEWAIGSIVAGEQADIQKFLVLYGEHGSGKSTILHVIEDLFSGYYTTFVAKSLGSNNNVFATEVFRSNPLVGIQHDGDLSRIEDNSVLNSLISHEDMVLNAKYEKSYTSRINCFLFMATNRPVKITDAKSGIIRRLIDVHPSNEKIPRRRYDELRGRIKFELGAIAWHCMEVYKDCGKTYYDAYKPIDMMYKTDMFYNFVEDSYDIFKEQNGVTLKQAWEMWKTYREEALIDSKLPMYKFREELKNYFASYRDFARIGDKQLRKYYSGFLIAKFEASEKVTQLVKDTWLKFNTDKSLFDEIAADYPAQLATDDEKPIQAWNSCETKLCDIDTSKLHYVRVPINHIVIDFDIRDENGSKSYEKNLEAATKFPPTYAELSKSGAGIHLHYIYSGDVEKLKSIYAPDIEVKVFKGKSSLRRRLVKCNDIPIATINSGLPLKEEETTKVIDAISIENEQHLRNKIAQALRKEVKPGKTITCIQYIKDVLDKAYQTDGFTYDVSDLKERIYLFALSSTNHPGTCADIYTKMHFMSKDHERSEVTADLRFADNAPRVFYDIESLPNVFLICWKIEGINEPVHSMMNPSRAEVYNWLWTEDGKLRYRLVGFNNKHYDNAMVMGAIAGDTVYELFLRSQSIIAGNIGAVPRGSQYISETDILDFSSDKKGLKKWEIELHLPHKELPWKWDKPIPEEMWPEVIKYCTNDVLQTEALFYHLEEDFKARQMLAKSTGMTINNSTNELTGQFIFGNDKEPQKEFNYRFMGDVPEDILVLNTDTFEFTEEHGRTAEELIAEGKFSVFDKQMRPIFPGYTFNQFVKVHKSQYRGEDPKEGGYVYAERGMYSDVALLDIASMHPSTIIAENLFGDRYTQRYKDLVQLRLFVKHREYDQARHMLGGVFAEYLDNESAAKQLAKTLKIPINAVYGQSSAGYPNRFKDPKNIDNIVAKRGALFMINLKHEVQRRGFTVAHIKTDSIKIPNATPEIIEFVNKYGKVYGYNFEHEATYDRMCLVNNAVYIARYKFPDEGKWTATGAQFAHPYIFKTLFSKEPLEFYDLCETKTVTSAMYLDMNEGYPDVTLLEKEYEKLLKKDPSNPRIEELKNDISKGHNYVFIGKAGQYCPMKKGTGGGLLMRESDGKYDAVAGTKGYRWIESDVVLKNHKENDIDMTYFEKLADAAVNDISKYGDFTWFVSTEPKKDMIDPLPDIVSDELPF